MTNGSSGINNNSFVGGSNFPPSTTTRPNHGFVPFSKQNLGTKESKDDTVSSDNQ